MISWVTNGTNDMNMTYSDLKYLRSLHQRKGQIGNATVHDREQCRIITTEIISFCREHDFWFDKKQIREIKLNEILNEFCG